MIAFNPKYWEGGGFFFKRKTKKEKENGSKLYKIFSLGSRFFWKFSGNYRVNIYIL